MKKSNIILTSILSFILILVLVGVYNSYSLRRLKDRPRVGFLIPAPSFKHLIISNMNHISIIVDESTKQFNDSVFLFMPKDTTININNYYQMKGDTLCLSVPDSIASYATGTVRCNTLKSLKVNNIKFVDLVCGRFNADNAVPLVVNASKSYISLYGNNMRRGIDLSMVNRSTFDVRHLEGDNGNLTLYLRNSSMFEINKGSFDTINACLEKNANIYFGNSFNGTLKKDATCTVN